MCHTLQEENEQLEEQDPVKEEAVKDEEAANNWTWIVFWVQLLVFILHVIVSTFI